MAVCQPENADKTTKVWLIYDVFGGLVALFTHKEEAYNFLRIEMPENATITMRVIDLSNLVAGGSSG